MTTSQIYWLTRLDGIHDFLGVISMIALCLGCMTLLAAAMIGYVENSAPAKAFAKSCLVWTSAIVVSTGLLACFVPTTKELIAIYGISYLTQNKDAREIPAQALKVLNEKLKEMEKD